MKIDYLWHSEMIIRMKNDMWKEISILSDSWLSDYCVWDLMWRNPQLQFDYKKLWHIDAIFLSHSHTDHIDPYTLCELCKNLETAPMLLVSETIAYLIPLFTAYLHNPEIIILENKTPIDIKWITLEWFIFENEIASNEDDVMWLFVSNSEEIMFTEVHPKAEI